MIEPKVVMGSLHEDIGAVEGIGALCRFRWQLSSCLSGRADAVFELTDALGCRDGPVRSLVDLALAAEHRRGHGARYDGLHRGLIEIARLRRRRVQLPLPRVGGRIVLAVDVSPWLRPDAPTCPQRLCCPTYRRGKGNAQLVPGWPYSVVAAVEGGRTSGTAVLDAVRRGPADEATAVTTAQVRQVVARLRQARHWHPGEADILIVADSGYDVTRLAFVLADLPVQMIGRLRADRVMLGPAPERQPGTNGRPPRHGAVVTLAAPASWPAPQVATTTDTSRYGTARATGGQRLHPRRTHRGPWADHDGELPIGAATLIHLQVDHLPGDRDPTPGWLATSHPQALASDVDRAGQAFGRRFALEHTFRFFTQVLGPTTPKIRNPDAADRWTWLVLLVQLAPQASPVRQRLIAAALGRARVPDPVWAVRWLLLRAG